VEAAETFLERDVAVVDWDTVDSFCRFRGGAIVVVVL